MTTATLDDFLALNEQLIALHAAGVELDPALGLGGDEVAANLARINAQVARRVRRGDSLMTALQAEDAALPPAYRALIQTGLRSGEWAATLGGHRRLSQTVERARHAVLLGFVYPAIICGMVFVGLIAFCCYVAPALEDLYGPLGSQNALTMRAIHLLRESLSIWIAAPLVVLVGGAVLRWRANVARSRGDSLEIRCATVLPGMSHTLHLMRCANFADTLATLVEHGTELRQGLQLAAATCGDAGLSIAATELAMRELGPETRVAGPEQLAHGTPFPPFLRWALSQANDVIETPRALRITAEAYRESAERRFEWFSIVAPLVVTAVIGGSATLLYAVVLFAPLVQLLKQLS